MTGSLKKYNMIVFVIMAIGAFAMAFPFVWMILSSFKTSNDVYIYPPKWLPSQFNLDNYKTVFRMIPFGRYYLNSIYTTLIAMTLDTCISIMTAYALAKLDFPGRDKFYVFVQSSMFVPIIVTMIPLFLIVSKLRLIDTYAGIILPQILPAFTTLLMFGFVKSIPDEMIEAAKIDGCGYLTILLKIVVPNSTTIISTAAMFSFLGHWRNYTWPLIVTNRTEMRTLPIGLKYLVQEASSQYQIMMAASVMAIVPVLIAYMLMEKQFVRSITLTGIKG